MTKVSLLLSSLLVISVVLSVPVPTVAGGERYFPETGKEAVHQRALDLNGGAVVLSVALQPGYEDLTLLSYLRLGMGARTFVAYVTDGEATPSDFNGLPPQFVAGERQEEAYAATHLLGAQSQFLNFPDPGVLQHEEQLARAWNPDSLLLKLVTVLRSYNPDVVIVQGDLRGDSVQSMRQRYLSALVMKAVDVAAGGKRDSSGVSPWRVHRILVESQPDPGQMNADFNKIHPSWKRSYRAIADDARGAYQTLRFQLPAWLTRGERKYKQVWPAQGRQPSSIVAGFPVLTLKIRSLERLVHKAAGREVRGVRTTNLTAVSQAIDSVNYFLARQRPLLSSADLRPVALWKNILEDLRCSLLDVVVNYAVSDSLVTQSQLVYLNFKGLSSKSLKVNTQIFFPGVMEQKWGLNEASKYQFPFTPPVEYRVITPQSMDFNMPAEQFGIHQPFLRNRFPFLIFHQDSVWGRDFIYRGEVLFRSGPRRTFELLTPAIRAVDGAPVVVRMQNISRDAYKGTITLSDSTIATVEKPVEFSRKDQIILDTLRLAMHQPFPEGNSLVHVSLSGMPGTLPVIVRNFGAAIDTSSRVQLVTRMEHGVVADALRRLTVPFSTAPALGKEDGGNYSVLVIDRDALAGAAPTEAEGAALRRWVQAGGRLVVFAQDGMGTRGVPLLSGVRFADGPLVAATDSLLVSPEDSLFDSPNVLHESDWQNWVVSRSQKSVALPVDLAANVAVRAPRGRSPLLVTVHEGKGEVIYVALDLISQLVNIHPGAHRLLANIVSSR